MEKRAILAAVLMAAVFIVYQLFLPSEPAPPQKPPAQTASKSAPEPPPPAAAPAHWHRLARHKLRGRLSAWRLSSRPSMRAK